MKTTQDYIDSLPEDRKSPVAQLTACVRENLSDNFEEGLLYKMIGFYVPKSIYPAGYHVGKNYAPLPFINIASQKSFIALYHSGLYASNELLEWFKTSYPQYSKTKLDMGKSCIRFKKVNDIPLELIAQLCRKMSVKEWITLYEKSLNK